MKNKTLLIIVIVVLISIATWVLLNKKTISVTDQTNQQDDLGLEVEKPHTLFIFKPSDLYDAI